MTRTLKLAAIQLDVTPAPLPDRLARAQRLIEQAAQGGAQRIVLPEVFNSGYRYTDENYRRAESAGGPTITWMKALTTWLNIHLAGSLFLRDGMETYNSLLLIAPDGRSWRYDKNYPWGWERAYYREGRGISIAHTGLGDIGMMICWDCAHPELWQQYAGQIDLLLISSCPPDVSNPSFEFPNGDRVTFDQMGSLFRQLKGGGEKIFGTGLNQQTVWLHVPVINTVGIGKVDTDIPDGMGNLLMMLPFAPQLVKYLPQAWHMRLSCNMTSGCKIVNAQGEVLSECAPTQGESFALAEVALSAEHPQPIGPQPPRPVPWLTYFTSDLAIPWLMRRLYRRGVRPHMAYNRRWHDFHFNLNLAYNSTMATHIEKVVTRVNIEQQTNGFAYWQTQSYQARLDALEELRQEYHLWRYGAEPKLEPVYRILRWQA
jgi:hypothetical protein